MDQTVSLVLVQNQAQRLVTNLADLQWVSLLLILCSAEEFAEGQPTYLVFHSLLLAKRMDKH